MSRKVPKKRRSRLLALEPRVLFDGALAADLTSDQLIGAELDKTAATTAPAEPTQPVVEPVALAQPVADEKALDTATTAELPAEPVQVQLEPGRREVVFIDSAVPGRSALVEALREINPSAELVLLDAGRDAIDQMAAWMDSRSGIDAVHIVSHGSTGQLLMSGQAYTADKLADYTVELARIGRAMTADGDILLYGCDVAAGTAGDRFIRTLASMTGADIAASVDATGAVTRGDWVLEASTGTIDAQVLLDRLQAEKWDFSLAGITPDGPLSFRNDNRSLISGTNLQAGAEYKFTNVATVNGTQIDGYIKIVSINNAVIGNFDNDAPGSYTPPAGTTNADIWAPEIRTTAANGNVLFEVRFRDSFGNDLTLFNFVNNTIDVDGQAVGSANQEFVEYGGFTSYSVGTPTDIAISQGGGDRLRFTGTNAYNGLVVNDRGRVQATFDAVTTLQIVMGATWNTGAENRQYGSLFSSIAFTQTPSLNSPPTV
ncbi:MAG: DUF4347 domain-containing protein, partial [Arenimonas sp.]|nr:DUF4347 domain-containing protein [Arenimonas sp.]